MVEHKLSVQRACAMSGLPRSSWYRSESAGATSDAAVIDALQARMDLAPRAMRTRRRLVEHPFGTIKAWMGHTHFLMKRLPNVKTEISLHILAYNMKRVMAVLGTKPLMEAIRA